ncbi:MAG: putative lipoprotein [Dehalococcoidia bacterium]|nr:putative lipoprotein [Dehalococcoidia bacterium]
MYVKDSNQLGRIKKAARVKWIALFAGILIAGLLVLTISNNKAYSMSNGLLTGRSTTGCAPCHGAAANPNVKVVISGPTTVTPGNTIQYSVTLNGNPEAGGGLNVSASDGKLSPGENTQLVNGEITQKDKNSRIWTLSWTAPSIPGQYVLSAVGNAVNKDGSPAGDGWNVGRLEISVAEAQTGTSTPAPTVPPTGSGPAATPASAPVPPAPAVPKPPTLSLKTPEIKSGQGTATLTASLKDDKGRPISGATISFNIDTEFFLSSGDVPVDTSRGPYIADYGAQDSKVKGLMEVGQAKTNADGIATLKYTPAIGGDLKLVAKYESANPGTVENSIIWQSTEQGVNYHPEIGIETSFLRPKWILGIILGSIWSIFLYVLYQIFAITREKTD